MLLSHCCLYTSIPKIIVANCVQMSGKSTANISCAPVAYTCITFLFTLPSTMRILPNLVLCNVLFWFCCISHDTIHIFFINSAVHHLADHLDLIHCQYCSCCILHCSVSTPSRARFHPSFFWECVVKPSVPVWFVVPLFSILEAEQLL